MTIFLAKSQQELWRKVVAIGIITSVLIILKLVFFWSFFSQGLVFNTITVALFDIAVIWEFLRWSTYCRSDCPKLEKQLDKLKNRETNNSSLYENSDWIRKHLIGDIDISGKFQPRILDGRFILLKYPLTVVRVPQSSLRFIPGILTAIGILGTFWGIQAGLSGISLQARDYSELSSSVGFLLAGMKTAFITSLVGLGTASIFTGVLATSNWDMRRRQLKLREKLDKVAVLETSEQIFSRIDFRGNQEAALALKDAATVLGEKFTPEAIGRAVGEAIAIAFQQTVRSELRPVFDSIAESQRRLEDLSTDQRNVLHNLLQDMKKELIQPVVERLDQSASLTREASQAVSKLNSELGDISQRLATAVISIREFQTQTLVDLQGFARSLESTLSEFREQTSFVLQDTAKEIRSGTLEILNQAQDTFAEQANTLRGIGQESTNLMSQASNHLVTSLQGIDQKLDQMSQATQDALQRFRESYQANLTEFFEKQNNLLADTLGEQREGLAEVVVNLNQTFNEEYERRRELSQEVDHSIKVVYEATKEVGKLVDAIGLNAGNQLIQMQELAREISEQVERVERVNYQLNQQYQETLTTWMKQLHEAHGDFFKEADQNLAGVSDGLLKVANLLLDASKNRT